MSDYLNSILLVGCGYMGREYCRVLQALKADICVVGRGETSAKRFYEETGVMPYIGGISKFLSERGISLQRAIVATNVEELYETVKLLIDKGAKEILVEKPGAFTYEQIQELNALAKEHETDIFIAYNRRFYASVRKAKELINEDGGVSSFRFEFTEWIHKILSLGKDPSSLQQLFLGNSTHVVDLAFYLGGVPEEMCSYAKGSLDWCGKPGQYSGAGVTLTGATFSYYADWESAGRWSVEILTKKRKMILCPLEELRCQDRGSLSVEKMEIDDTLDQQFKPGLYLETKAFLDHDFNVLLPIQEHVRLCTLYRQIEEGSKD